MDAVATSLAAYGAAFMAALLAASAAHKLADRRRLAGSAARLTGLGEAWGAPALFGAALVETAAAVGLIAPQTRPLAALVAAGLWSLYLALILRAMAAGHRDIDCGCAFGRGHARLGRFEIGRNLTLAGLGVLVAVGGGAGGQIGISEILAGAALLSLYVATDQVALLAPAPGWR